MPSKPEQIVVPPDKSPAQVLAELVGETKGKNKFHAKPTLYDGRTYDSKAEAAYAEQLDLLKAAGRVSFWVPQPLVVLDALEYRPDFLVAEPWPGLGDALACYFVDVKGQETQRFRDIRKMWARHGPHELRVVKANGNYESIWPIKNGGRP